MFGLCSRFSDISSQGSKLCKGQCFFKVVLISKIYHEQIPIISRQCVFNQSENVCVIFQLTFFIVASLGMSPILWVKGTHSGGSSVKTLATSVLQSFVINKTQRLLLHIAHLSISPRTDALMSHLAKNPYSF